MLAEAHYDNVLGALYEAAVSPDLWQSTLTDLARWTGANEFHLLRWDSAQQQPTFNIHSEGVDAAVEQYGAYYSSIDPRRLQLATGPVGQVSACQHHFEDRYISRSEFYQDFLGAWGMSRSLSSLLAHDGDDQLMLGLIRAKERGAFDAEDIDRLARVMPHLQRACRIWIDTQRLQEQVALGEKASGSAGLAWLGLDADGAVLHANPLAEELLREDDTLVMRRGRLHATHADDAARLRSAIAEAARGLPAHEFTVAGRRSGADACALSVVGAGAAGPTQATVLVTIRRRDAPRAPSAQRLAQAFGLTPAESKVGLALLEGKTPAEYAEVSRLSIATVRSHLSAVLAKTCTRRQAEAVQVLRDLRF